MRLLFDLSLNSSGSVRQSLPHSPTNDPGIRFKYMELAPVYDLSAVNQRHFRNFQFLVQRDSRFRGWPKGRSRY
ncbi:MAG: hypothetical protein QOE55_3862 [Acidobacteriaceae bacterium]|nr:hypothetical protein [Acidobacteriaceae bacterium]